MKNAVTNIIGHGLFSWGCFEGFTDHYGFILWVEVWVSMIFNLLHHILDQISRCLGGWQIELMIHKKFCVWYRVTTGFTLEVDYSQHLMNYDFPRPTNCFLFVQPMMPPVHFWDWLIFCLRGMSAPLELKEPSDNFVTNFLSSKFSYITGASTCSFLMSSRKKWCQLNVADSVKLSKQGQRCNSQLPLQSALTRSLRTHTILTKWS